MFNWFIVFFSAIAAVIEWVLGSTYFILPLITILISRLIFSIIFFWVLFHEDRSAEVIKLTRGDYLHFFGATWLIIFFSTFFPYVGAFFSIYSLLMSAGYLKKYAHKIKNLNLLRFSNTLQFLWPLLVGTIYSIVDDIFNLVSISLALSLYIVHGMHVIDKGKSNYIQRKRNRYIRKRGKIIKAISLIIVFIVPLFTVVATIQAGTRLKETLMVEMSDGVHLATDIYYAPGAKDKPRPVVITRTPYGKDKIMSFGIPYSKIYGSQGYHVVAQDFRGCYDSEGGDEDFLVMTHAYTDGVDTLNWILDQPWCNGKIASAGVSAGCINQYYYAGMNPDGLVAQSLWFGTPDLVKDAIVEGAFHERLVEDWIKDVAPNNWRQQLSYIYDYINDPSSTISAEPPRTVSLDYAPNTFDQVNVHALHVGGWYDHFLRGTIRGYVGYDDYGGEEARGHQKLIIGPWIHGMVFMQDQGELHYPMSANGLLKLLDWEVEIWDEILLDKPNPEIWEGDRVAYYLMGDVDDAFADANKWKYAKDWPLDYTWEEWYFSNISSGDMVVQKGSENLVSSNFSYIYDPKDPVLNRGGGNDPSRESMAGPMDQRPVEDGRDDVLLFKSPVLEQPLTFEGNLKAKLFVKSNCTDTDFMIKISDIYPDGRRMLITDGALSSRFHINTTSRTPLIPGEKYEIDIDLVAIAYQFNTGHQIAISVTSSNYDRYALNANTGADFPNSYIDTLEAKNTIICGQNGSRIYFPILN